jgi:hypothetical protein
VGPRIAALAEHITVERGVSMDAEATESTYESVLRDLYKRPQSTFYETHLRTNAKKYAETHFTMEIFIDKWLKMFTKSAHFNKQ